MRASEPDSNVALFRSKCIFELPGIADGQCHLFACEIDIMVGMKDFKRILYLLPVPRYLSRFEGVGGHIAHTCGVVRAFSNFGYEVDIVAEEDWPDIKKYTSNIYIVPIENSVFSLRLLWSFQVFMVLKRLIQHKTYSFAYVRYSVSFSPFIPHIKAALRGIPLVLELNSFAAQKYPFVAPFERRAIQSADIVVCVSESLKEIVVSKLGKRLMSKIVVVPNGVDIDRFQNAEVERSYSRHGKSIGYVGILKKDYGIETLLSAFLNLVREHNEFELHIIGDGPIKSRLERNVVGKKQVCFHGAVPMQEIPGVLKALDILVYTASERTLYQSPVKIMEYMASGTPIIAARTPFTEQLLGEEERGLLYDVDDERMLHAKLLQLNRDKVLAADLARRAFKEVSENYTWENTLNVLMARLRKQDNEKNDAICSND